ncbi:MAG TPA: DedA family protein [Pseudonocardiaceae bacterium]
MDPVSWLEHVADGSPVVLLFVVMLALFLDSLAVVGALLPGDMLLLVPSAAAAGPAEVLLVIAGGITGTMLGYTASYLVGRWTGPAIRGSWMGRRVGEHRWSQAEQLLRGPAGRTLALVQFMPVLNYLVPLLSGTLDVPLKRFLRLTGIGAVAYSTFYVTLGALAGGTGEVLGDATGRLIGLLVVAVGVAGLGVTVMARAARRMAQPQPSVLADEPDPVVAGQVDVAARNMADSASCSTAAFSTGTGCRCP